MAETATRRQSQLQGDPATREQLTEFVRQEARLLDEKRFEEWIELFTEDGYYWVPARPDQENPYDEISIFFDDRSFMQTRYGRLRHPRVHAQIPASRTFHLIADVRVEPESPAGADYLVSSGMIMLEYRPGGQQQIFGGRCSHAIRIVDGKMKLAWKKVNLINCDGMFNPILLPF